MQKGTVISTLFILTLHLAYSQNLVPNGDFEIYSTLPVTYGQSNLAVGWTNVNGDYSGPPYASPDYYVFPGFMGSAFGPILPFSGNAQMGFTTYHDMSGFREYISIQLLNPLNPGHQYQVSFYLTSGSGGSYTKHSNGIGVHFSSGPLFQLIDQPIPVIPQVEITSVVNNTGFWQNYTFTFTATASYDYMTIGNFRDDINTTVSPGNIGAYYFIDKIEVTSFNSMQVNGDSVICKGESSTLTASGSSFYAWADSLNPGIIISTDSSLVVSPAVTTTYFVYGSLDTLSFTVNVFFPMNLDIGNDTILCLNDSLLLDVSYPNTSCLWQDMSTNPVYTAIGPGIYWVELNTPCGFVSDTIRISLAPQPVISLGNDTSLCEGETLRLDATSPGASYQWQNYSTDPVYILKRPGIYWVKVTNTCGSDYDTLVVDEKDCRCSIYVPNAFTPNQDNLNDDFIPVSDCPFAEYHFTVFSRWGEEVFNTNNPKIAWNGFYKDSKAAAGVYTYLLTYKFEKGKTKFKAGFVYLLL